MYDVSFVKLTERFFKGVPWPPVELLSELVDHDHVFCMLYKVRRRPDIWVQGTKYAKSEVFAVDAGAARSS